MVTDGRSTALKILEKSRELWSTPLHVLVEAALSTALSPHLESRLRDHIEKRCTPRLRAPSISCRAPPGVSRSPGESFWPIAGRSRGARVRPPTSWSGSRQPGAAGGDQRDPDLRVVC
jgi:hypothetical protein